MGTCSKWQQIPTPATQPCLITTTTADQSDSHLRADNCVTIAHFDRKRSSPVQPGRGRAAVSLTYGHFDDDEYFDVVVSNQGNDTHTMLLTQGQPGLTLRQNLDVGRQPVHVLTADFNQDRKSDLMVAEEADQNVSILRVRTISDIISR